MSSDETWRISVTLEKVTPAKTSAEGSGPSEEYTTVLSLELQERPTAEVAVLGAMEMLTAYRAHTEEMDAAARTINFFNDVREDNAVTGNTAVMGDFGQFGADRAHA